MYKLELRLYTYIIHICAHNKQYMSMWSTVYVCVVYACENVVSRCLLACGYYINNTQNICICKKCLLPV